VLSFTDDGSNELVSFSQNIHFFSSPIGGTGLFIMNIGSDNLYSNFFVPITKD